MSAVTNESYDVSIWGLSDKYDNSNLIIEHDEQFVKEITKLINKALTAKVANS